MTVELIPPSKLSHPSAAPAKDVVMVWPDVVIRRGRDGHDSVLVKAIAEGADAAVVAAALRAEWALAEAHRGKGLHLPHTLRETEHGPVLIYADPGLAPLLAAAVPPMTAARGLAQGLADLHALGRLHLGFCPESVLLSPDGETAMFSDLHRLSETGRGHRAAVAGRALPFQAPELGRGLQREADARADLYALGAVLYQVATGLQPFAAPDAATILHRHMTLIPQAPVRLRPDLPAPLSDMILHLLAKNPDDRPASALAVLQDLGFAQAGRRPLPAIPERVFGQAEPTSRLTRQIAEGLSGGARLIRVAGPSGAGKSTLIAGLDLSAACPGALVAQGKFDQLDRAQPYSAFVQAFEMVLRHMLSGDTATVDRWRAQLLEALSPNAQVLLDILPRYQALLGPQPPVPDLGLAEAQIRVSLVFRRFLAAVARADAPLILFLDDLQWADSASLGLIQLILSDTRLQHLIIMTAYRDTEVSVTHPVARMVEEIEAAGQPLPPAITLRPLQRQEVAELIGATLGTQAHDAADLARIVARKTAGNPYFVRQFLLALLRKLPPPADENAPWSCDAQDALAEALPENVVDLVAERIQSLPEETQALLRLAACIGSRFDVALLTLCSDLPAETVQRHLRPALQSDVLGPDDAGPNGGLRYRFLHDRVQQAAYDMLDPAGQSAAHARLGAVLTAQMDARQLQPGDVADHLIAGWDDLTPGQRSDLRRLALSAAKRSLASGAYEAALRYLDAAERTCDDDPWHSEPALIFQITLDKARLAYLRNDSATAQAQADALLAKDLTLLDRVAVLELKILLHTSQLQYLRALDIGKEALALLGHGLPHAPGTLRVLAELAYTMRSTAKRGARAMLDLPPMSDPKLLAAMRIFALLAPPAYFSAPNLLPLLGMKMVRLTQRHGIAPDSSYGYVIFAMLHGVVLGHPRRALELGELAMETAGRPGMTVTQGRTGMVFTGFIKHWTAPLTATLPMYLQAAEQAITSGDLENHGYARYGHASYALMAGLPLPQVAAFLEEHLAAVTMSRHEKTYRIMCMALASVQRMRAQPHAGHTFDEAASFAIWTDQSDATSLAYFHKYKLLEALMVGDFAQVLHRARGMKANLNGILSMAYHPYFQFYQALSLLHLAQEAGPGRGAAMRLHARGLTARLGRLSRDAPETLTHRVALLRAEAAAARGDAGRALAGFDAALRLARASGSLHDQALFAERMGLFLLRHGAQDQARGHLRAAWRAYGDWGGTAWQRALQARHPHLDLTSAAQANAADVTTTLPNQIDSEALLRAAEVMTEKTSVKDIVDEVLATILRNVGALRGVLLLEEDGTLNAVAQAVAPDTPAPEPGAIAYPQGIVNYTFHAAEPVVLDDASQDRSFARDPDILHHKTQSVLCVPLTARGFVIGVIYLENTVLRGAFPPERARMAEVLGSQAAISLQNARLLQRQQELLERQVDMTSAHARFVPHTFLNMLGRPSINEVRLGDFVRAQSSILFIDIRGFTPLIETMPPDRVIGFINTFLSRIEPAVRGRGGFIDSIIGDAVMAVFQYGPEDALEAALTMLRALQGWHSDGALGPGVAPVQVGIGIATGELIFGTIGAANRLKCGVLGDTVNLASRIEGLTKHYGVRCLITDETFRALPNPDRFLIREVDRVAVVGRKAPVVIYDVYDTDPAPLRDQKRDTAPMLALGLAQYRAGDLGAARASFADCVARAPSDPVAQVLLEQCQTGPAPKGADPWSGITHMKTK